MAADEKPIVELGRTETGYIVQVAGRGTMSESRALHEFALAIVGDHSCTLAIDLSQCEYLDSTFLGCLVDLYKRFGSGPTDCQRFEIIADQERCRNLLAATHLHTFLPVREQPPPRIEDPLALATGGLDRRQLGQHIMECHRRLAELGGPNQEVFNRIADQLETDLDKEPDKP